MSFTQEQITDGQEVISAVKGEGLSPADTALAELDAIEAGLAESGLRNINYGDYPASMGGRMSSSRGVFQQIAAWGPESARENPVTAAQMFLQGGQGGQRGLLGVRGWDTMASWNAVQAVQQSEFSDGSNYRAQLTAAQQFINQYGAGAGSVAGGTGAPATAGAGPASSVQPTSYLGDVGTVLWMGIRTFIFEGFFIVTGLGMVMLGAWRMSSSARHGVEAAAAAAAPAVAA